MKTGLSLINAILEFERMAGDDISKWFPENFTDNEPRFIRLQIIDVLSNLFLADVYQNKDLPFRVNSILYGDFIERRNFEEYSDLFSKIDETIAGSRFKDLQKDGEWEEWGLHTLQYSYQKLVGFKRGINRLERWNSGFYEISYPYLISVVLTEKVIESIDLREIDKLIWSFIDPKRREFSEETLIKEMNYPPENLCEIDDDWW
jgi:hypothetical protein